MAGSSSALLSFLLPSHFYIHINKYHSTIICITCSSPPEELPFDQTETSANRNRNMLLKEKLMRVFGVHYIVVTTCVCENSLSVTPVLKFSSHDSLPSLNQNY